MSKKLDYSGLTYLITKIKSLLSTKVDKIEGKGLSSLDFTQALKTKLDGIAVNANNYSHPTTSGNKHIPSGGSAGQLLSWSEDGTAVWTNPTAQTDEVITNSEIDALFNKE